MIRSTKCANCEYELIFPSEWVERSIQCPRCKNVLPITPQMVGQKRSRNLTLLRRTVQAAGALIVVLGLVFLFMMPWGKAVQAVQDPMLKLRCTRCDGLHERERSDWEKEVFDSIEVTDAEKATSVPILEEVPSTCPHCGEKAAYLQTRTALCPKCGHWAPSFEPLIVSALRRAPGCPHCAAEKVKADSVQ
jgi:predicted Zn-ribbon and HTH transcriptional regulator